jgi:hypothetical protein
MHAVAMEYLIGAGAILETQGAITPATLHAQLQGIAADGIAAAAVDFESSDPALLKRLLVMGSGWDAARFRGAVSDPLRTRRECSLADVLEVLATATGAAQVHLFARWVPGRETLEALRRAGISVISHPLESIGAAAIVSGQRCKRWRAA